MKTEEEHTLMWLLVSLGEFYRAHIPRPSPTGHT
ncbi:rCG58567 [Rattus norvegicus]|uniref:RCG58567 n=1 Tax=Rattus norvegicus TaxID=10116 RepID=A6K713_RAT|nr:rCG58567 [Rattus norvegicus]